MNIQCIICNLRTYSFIFFCGASILLSLTVFIYRLLFRQCVFHPWVFCSNKSEVYIANSFWSIIRNVKIILNLCLKMWNQRLYRKQESWIIFYFMNIIQMIIGTSQKSYMAFGRTLQCIMVKHKKNTRIDGKINILNAVTLMVTTSFLCRSWTESIHNLNMSFDSTSIVLNLVAGYHDFDCISNISIFNHPRDL